MFRFLAHPFNSAIALSQLTDDIDITGTGGTSNGFTATINNNPSAYYFDVASANNTSSGLNPGWTDFANTTSNSWAKASPALIYIRGAKGEAQVSMRLAAMPSAWLGAVHELVTKEECPSLLVHIAPHLAVGLALVQQAVP